MEPTPIRSTNPDFGMPFYFEKHGQQYVGFFKPGKDNNPNRFNVLSYEDYTRMFPYNAAVALDAGPGFQKNAKYLSTIFQWVHNNIEQHSGTDVEVKRANEIKELKNKLSALQTIIQVKLGDFNANMSKFLCTDPAQLPPSSESASIPTLSNFFNVKQSSSSEDSPTPPPARLFSTGPAAVVMQNDTDIVLALASCSTSADFNLGDSPTPLPSSLSASGSESAQEAATNANKRQRFNDAPGSAATLTPQVVPDLVPLTGMAARGFMTPEPTGMAARGFKTPEATGMAARGFKTPEATGMPAHWSNLPISTPTDSPRVVQVPLPKRNKTLTSTDPVCYETVHAARPTIAVAPCAGASIQESPMTWAFDDGATDDGYLAALSAIGSSSEQGTSLFADQPVARDCNHVCILPAHPVLRRYARRELK
jgi:hypothetical protein